MDVDENHSRWFARSLLGARYGSQSRAARRSAPQPGASRGTARPYLPALRELAKELKKYPNAELVDVTDADNHVQVAIVDGKIQIDAVEPRRDHSCPGPS